MCGIAGFWRPSGGNEVADRALGLAMAEAVRHRGPDAGDVWADAAAGVTLAHRRLAIIDLSAAGAQPMHSASGRYVVAYNGEIYNFPELRAELEQSGAAPEWRGHSDTEVLLAGIECWGLDGTLRKAKGMWAIALWDRRDGTLTLARDRVGEKPLYYGWFGEGDERCLLFGSELAALQRHPQFVATLDRDAFGQYLQLNYVPAPLTRYVGVAKLLPGHITTIHPSGDAGDRRYWSFADVIVEARADPFLGSPEEAVSETERVLSDAIARQMIADVPLGAFLSGGIDSSTVVALMQARSNRPVETFTIGFDQRGYDEAQHAKAVAQHLGTRHHEFYVSPQETLDVIPRLPTIYSEPFADSSQVPTFLVAQMARRNVTVALSGDAGDELFGGYNRYLFTDRMWGGLRRVPGPLRSALGAALGAVPLSVWDRLGGIAGRARVSNFGDKVHKGASMLGARDADALYEQLITLPHMRDIALSPGVLRTLPPPGSPSTAVERMMALDSVGYLPDDILAKVDRAAMACSLETRVPMLDANVIAHAWRLPLDYKVRNGETKWPLRQILYRHVPKALVDRPKMGFGIPVGDWLRGPLRDWASDLLDPTVLAEQQLVDVARVTRLWDEHQSGRRSWTPQLWTLLMFEAWRREQPH